MRKQFLVALVLLLFLVTTVGVFAGGVIVGRRLQIREQLELSGEFRQLDLVEEVIRSIRQNYVEDVSTSKLIKGAIKGTLEALDDPYSQYLDKTHFKAFEEETSGFFDGVGLVIGEKDGQIIVERPLEGTPAARAGIKMGDLIVTIDGKSTKGMAVEDAVKLIRGKRETTVTLTIRRPNVKEDLKFTLVRAKIEFPNVTNKMLAGQIGYVTIHSFNQETGDSLREAIEKLKGEGAQGVILDLRGNPGGLLDAAISVGSQFIGSGPIVKVKERSGEVRELGVVPGADEKTPLVVLVNHGSASASEIVAGAIQDTRRGVVVGEKTFGKASVQTVLRLSDGSGILITTETYLTPNGRSIHKTGITPEVQVKPGAHPFVEGKDSQLDAAIDVIKKLIAGTWKPAA